MSEQTIMGNGNKVKGDTSKTKITISIGSVVIIAIILFVVFSNSNSIEKKIIGTWQINEEPQIYVMFGENGTFSMTDDEDYIEGTYTFINDNMVKVHINYLWIDFTLSGDVSISGGNMTISDMSDPDDIFDADGKTITLKKTK